MPPTSQPSSTWLRFSTALLPPTVPSGGLSSLVSTALQSPEWAVTTWVGGEVGEGEYTQQTRAQEPTFHGPLGRHADCFFKLERLRRYAASSFDRC